MLSKAQSKYIRSLSQQKYRNENNAFLAEGDKIAKEWLASNAHINIIVATRDWLDENKAHVNAHHEAEVIEVETFEIEKISSLKTANKVLLVVEKAKAQLQLPDNGWVIALEHIQDPGNMGTILRIADWFGIKHVVCSTNCVDVYNAKVVQAAMGAHLRVNVHYTNLSSYIGDTSLPTYAAVLGSDNLYEAKHNGEGVILIGNESKGLSEEIASIASNKVTIPKLGGAESLNAGVSTGIIAAYFTAS